MNGLVRLFTIVVLAALASCGGGMQAGVGSGGSGAPVSVGIGPVTGFGSILMNGERYDETGAEVLLDERPDRPTPATVAAIRLGMHVELQHRNLVVSTATVSAELIGPVASVGASSLVVLAQTVRVNADPARPTVFDGFETLADLATGAVVEVHGDRATNGDILATRVERKPANLALVRIAGTATGAGSDSFAIGGLTVDTRSSAIVPALASLVNGARVIAWTDVPYTGGALVAKVVKIAPTVLTNNAAATLDGVIGDFQSRASFRVAGVPVNAANATVTGGSAASLANGAAVRVKGTVADGVVNAGSVELLQAAQATSQLTGPITDFIDATSAFRIRDSLVRVTPQTTYTGGSAANLGTGVVVKVTGPIVNGSVQATTVEFVAVAADVQRIVVGQVTAAPGGAAADGSRLFRIDSLNVDVKIASTTNFRNGVLADLVVARKVRVTGNLQGTQFLADEIQMLDNPASPPGVEIEGIASKVQPTSVQVSGQTVQLSGATTYTLDGVATTAASLKDGLRVEIVATRSGSTLTAVSVEIRSPAAASTTVRGIVSGRTGDAAQFLVGTQRVSVAGNPRVLPANKSLANVVNGVDLEVQGTLANGVLNATRIQFR